MLCAAGILAILLASWPRLATHAAIVYLGFWLSIGTVNNAAFQTATSKVLGKLTADARMLTTSMDLREQGGAVVGADRYGPVSYALFGLALNVPVISKPQSSALQSGDLPPGVRWVLCVGDYVPGFSFSGVQKTEHLRLYTLSDAPAQP